MVISSMRTEPHLREMFRSVVAIGNDVLTRGSRSCGSILIEEMTIAGN